MGSRYSSLFRTWFNGPSGHTAIEATVGPNKWESALLALDNAGDDFDDRISSLESFSLTPATVRRGQTADAGPPTLDAALFYNQQTSELWIPGGSAWYKTALTAVAGVSGGSNAPLGFSAVVNSDNTVSLAWTLPTPPSGNTITAVTAREKFASPGGVSGMPLAGTATTNNRPTSSSVSTREYYVTCTFSGGTESAESNHVTVYLPYGSSGTGGGGGTGGTGSTPAAILGIGTSVFFSIDIGNAGGANVSHTMAELTSGYVQSPYLEPNATNDAVALQCFANSGTTSGSPHPRTEFREVLSDGVTKAAWAAATGKNHTMSGTSTITHLPADSESSSVPKPQVCFGQIHDAAGDVVRLQVEESSSTPAESGGIHSSTSLHIVGHTHSPNGGARTEVKTRLASTYTVGTAINWKIEVLGTTCNLYINGTKQFTFTISGTGFYFKTGDYQQFSTAVTNSSGSPDGGYSPSSYARTELKNLVVTHSPAL